jgi:DNA modification methylase
VSANHKEYNADLYGYGDKAVTKEIATVEPRDESALEIPVTTSSTGSAASMQIRDRIKELRRVKAKDLLVNPKNWRRHPKAQADALRGLLGEIGYADALLARALTDGRLMLIDGHLRVETTPDAEVPVLVLDVSEEEADKLLLTLDPLAAMAESDSERIKALLETVRTDNEAVQELMRRTAGERLWAVLHPDELNEAEISPARADELRRKWKTEIGQLWCTDRHRIICADCTDQAEVARLWREESARARLIWTDPPYGVSYADKNCFLNKSDRGNRIQKPIINDHASEGEAGALFRDGLAVASRYCEPGASVYVSVPGGRSLVSFISALEAAGFTFRSTLVWVKNHFVLGMSDYHFRHELILYGWLPNGTHLWTGGRAQDSVFEVDRPQVSDLHPTTKPIELVARMIANSSRPAEFIYDPFCGSGSTIVAAHQLGRVGYGCELDPGYLAVSLERLSLLGLKPELVSKS